MSSRKAHAAHDFELNLTPIIDCFVTLICFLLLSATYVNLTGLDAKVPVAVPGSSVADDNKPKFKLELNITGKGMELVAGQAGAASGTKRFGLKDYAALHTELVRIKKERPKEFSIHFTSSVEMPFEELVKIMDTTRNLDAKDGNFLITDERNGKPVKVDTLFPDFVMAGLTTKGAL